MINNILKVVFNVFNSHCNNWEESRIPGDSETTASAISLAACEGRHWSDPQLGSMSGEPCSSPGERRHTPSGAVTHASLPGHPTSQYPS